METYIDYLQDALDIVSAWEISDENFGEIVDDQAQLMCGMHLEPSSDIPPHSPYAALRF